jgi:hypothetical protein
MMLSFRRTMNRSTNVSMQLLGINDVDKIGTWFAHDVENSMQVWVYLVYIMYKSLSIESITLKVRRPRKSPARLLKRNMGIRTSSRSYPRRNCCRQRTEKMQDDPDKDLLWTRGYDKWNELHRNQLKYRLFPQ